MKNPWEIYPEIWKNQSAFFTWLRGGLRRAIWEKYPPKLKFKNDKCTIPPDTYSGRAKSGDYCSLSGEWTPKSYLEVDHIIGHVSLKDWDDVTSFIQHLCTDNDNMQLVSKEAHKIKSYAERKGISYNEAKIEKEAIKIIKDKKINQFFEMRDLPIPLKKDARAQIVKILSDENDI